LEFIGTPHRALDDAINTTHLFAHMSKEFKLNILHTQECLSETQQPKF
jgi:inhibitor of KinA sporulation pathway (predicted exonuclease)